MNPFRAFPYRSLTLLGLLALGAGCASTDPYAENRKVLESACTHLEHGEYGAAAKTAESLLAGRAAESKAYALQRYYAAYVCAESHVKAAIHGPFLTEAPPSTAGLGLTADADDQASKAVASPNAHWVAASYYTGFARDILKDAKAEHPKQGEEERLPVALKEVDLARAQLELNLTRIAILRRLGFDAGCAELLEANPEMLEVASCQKLINQAVLPPELTPLIFYAGFAFRITKPQPDERSQLTTYLLGAKARMQGQASKGSLPAEMNDEVVRWVRENKEFEFRCDCNQPFQPALTSCEHCGFNILQAKAVHK